MNEIISIEQWMRPVWLSLQTALTASVIGMAVGASLAWGMTRRTFRGQTAVETIILLPLVLPPTVVGFLLLLGLGRTSWIGRVAEHLIGSPIVFSKGAAVIAGFVVALPLIYQSCKSGFHSVEKELEDAGRTMGASEWQVFRYITAPLAGYALRTAYILGFTRALGEFGATLMIAGNIPGRTQTVPTAIYVAVETGHFRLAAAWAIASVGLSFLLLFFARQRKLI